MSKYKSGFIAIVGRPNVGKSTLTNNLAGEKIAITSDKPQTTRNKINAVYTDNEAQFVFVDTPGIHKPKNKLGDFMSREIEGALESLDVLVFITDEKNKLGPGDRYIIENLRDIKAKKIALINKMDTGDRVENVIAEINEYGIFDEILRVSALKTEDVNYLKQMIKKMLPEGPKYYPEDYLTDRPLRFIAAEIIREKALNLLNQEVPHGVGVQIDKMQQRENSQLMEIFAVIHCEKKSHKGIIIGKNGEMLRKIGENSRREIENLLGTKVYLNLWVKVNKNWRDDERVLKELGYK